MNRHFLLLLAILIVSAAGLHAQTSQEGHTVLPTTGTGDDFGASLSLDIEKKLAKGLSLDIEGDFRSQDDSRRAERWLVGAGLSYRLYRSADKKVSVKANAGFEYLWKHKLGETEEHYNALGTMNGYNQTECYWRNRHRTSLGAALSYSPSKRWSFSLKETFQYNHYAAVDSVGRTKWRWKTNDDDEPYTAITPDAKTIGGKDRFVLRSKLAVEYNIKGLPLNPHVSIDYGCGLNYTASKWKYTAGMEFKINKQNKLDMFYRFSHENDDDEPNGHLVGLSYKINL